MNNVSSQSIHVNDVSHFLAQMSYDEQSDKLAGTIGLLKQLVLCCMSSHTSDHLFVDTLPAQAGKSPKMQRRFLVGGQSRFREWAS